MIGLDKWIILAILLVNNFYANGEQRFVETPTRYQEVLTGEDVQLRCKVQDKRGQCIWQKDRKPVGMHPDKYEWVGGRDSDCSLLIRRASLDFDDGFWECQVTSGDYTRQDSLTSLPARLLVKGTILCTLLILNKLILFLDFPYYLSIYYIYNFYIDSIFFIYSKYSENSIFRIFDYSEFCFLFHLKNYRHLVT